jgi:thiosulfate dehydrogenase
MNSQLRPHKVGIEADYPNRSLKPADAAYPSFADPFPAEQHRIGPWRPIEQWLKNGGAQQRAASPRTAIPL